MNIKNFLWPLPFICFWAGYYLVSTIYTQSTVTTPPLVGMQLVSAIDILSTVQLNPRILAQKQDPDLPEGMIISQTPAAHQHIKIGQPVYLVITKKPEDQATPKILGMQKKEMKRTVRKKKIHEKVYGVPHKKLADMAIGQHPTARMACRDNLMIIYYPESKQAPIIFPDLRKKTVPEVRQFLNEHGIKPRIEHMQPKKANHTCTHCHVAKQKPAAKSFVDVDEKSKVTLWVN